MSETLTDEAAETAPRIKCEVVTGEEINLHPCDFLSDLVTSKHNGLGIDIMQLVNMANNKWRPLWIIRSGKHAKKGIILNYCPMCGTNLQELYTYGREETQEQAP